MLRSRPVQLNTDGAYPPTKTPSRGLKNRIENAGSGVAMTVNGKGGKNASAFPRTAFQPSTVKLQTGKQRVLMTTASRPLGDKTPLPNRFGGNVLFQTPLPGMSKLSKLNQNHEDDGGNPDSAQRPSSMRKHIKHPRNSGGKAFETPANKGNHWDVSDGEIVVPEVLPEAIAEDEGGDDMDEVEYGPPNTLDLPYEPPFDFKLPDYKVVGKMLFQLAHSSHYDDPLLLPEPDFKIAELENANWDMMPLPAIESDDPFYLARVESLTLPPTVKASIARPKTISRSTKAPTVPPLTKPTTRSVPSRPTSRAAPSAASQPQKAPIASLGSTRPHSVASSRLATRTITLLSAAAKPLPSAATKAAAATAATLKRAPSTRSVSSNTTVHPRSGSAVPRARPGETRRPHTALAVGATTKAKSKVVPYVDEVIILKDVDFGMDDELDFKFDV